MSGLLALTLALHLPACGGGGGGSPADADDDAEMTHHDCSEPYPVDPRDRSMSGEPVRLLTHDNGTEDPSDDQYEVLPPAEIADWIAEQGWPQQHGDWHNIRRWDQGCLRFIPGFPCQGAETMKARGLSRAPIQEREPGDGYAFLVMHRHMIRSLKQAFPRHADSIRGFEHIPLSKDDPENPVPWIDVRWGEPQRRAFAFLEDIESHIDAFASEDELGKWIQFGTATALPEPGPLPPGVHGLLHAQWAVPGSPYVLTDNNVNVIPVAFWRSRRSASGSTLGLLRDTSGEAP